MIEFIVYIIITVATSVFVYKKLISDCGDPGNSELFIASMFGVLCVVSIPMYLLMLTVKFVHEKFN